MSFYVTTPIYYVNAKPHLGHAYTTIGADILARHMRQRGEDVFFLTGTDEHGEPVAQAAEREGVPPRVLADRNVVHFKDLVKRLEATNDFFIRTTDKQHVAHVQEFISQLHDRGEIYAGVYEGWYCPNCADFKTEQDLDEGRCPIHKIKLERESEDNYFFKLSSYQKALERYYAAHPDFILPKNRYNEALAFIKQGLTDVSISRSKLKWGVPLPWDRDQVLYVWFDALLNYVTALRYSADEDLSKRFWPADLHVMAKDILKFHAVIWPAMLLANEYELPRRMFIHGYLLMGGEKMSKTLGNVLDPNRVIDAYGADALRYYCCREVSFGQDGSVSTTGFEMRYNTELANELGNLANRTLAMIERYRDGVVPVRTEGALRHFIAPGDQARFASWGEQELLEPFKALLDRVEITAALEHVWQFVRALNGYIEHLKPWALAKDEQSGGEADALDRVLYNLAEGLRVLAVMLYPYMPDSSAKLLEALGEGGRIPGLDDAAVGSGEGGKPIKKLEPLFPKIEEGL